jgi:hypothetical protein
LFGRPAIRNCRGNGGEKNNKKRAWITIEEVKCEEEKKKKRKRKKKPT